MPSRRLSRPRKKPVFLAGEGLSERGYCRWLNRLAAETNAPVAIRAEALRGGDPLDLIEQSIDRLRTVERQRGFYRTRGLLLDGDLRGQSIERDAQAIRLAQDKRIRLIWQEPLHEAFLLRHFAGYENHRPPDQASAERLLRRVWPDFTKGLDGSDYGRVLTAEHLTVVRTVERDLNAFLRDAGWR
jgi:hypothetical protein